MKNTIKSCVKTMTGIITPISWDKDDQAQKFSLYTRNEEDILLIDPRKTGYLKKFINKWVTISGLIDTHGKVKKVIAIKKMKLLKKVKNDHFGEKRFDYPEFRVFLPKAHQQS